MFFGTRARALAVGVAALIGIWAGAEDVRETVLPNGLKVLTKEIHAAPVVSVWTYYRVGSRNERPGITGISHQIEHMMFKGTTTLKPGDIDRLTALAGGKNNAFTDTDYTAYYFAMPSDAAAPPGRSGLDTALRIEAGRMQNCAMDAKELAHEKDVVLSELEGDENSPLNRLDEAVKAAAFMAHPYHWPTIGWKTDVKAYTRGDVLGYYRTYYQPNNAALIIVGDFETDAVLARVRELFGKIPRGADAPKVVTQEPPQAGERRVTLKGEGSASYCQVLYHIPETSHPDTVVLGVLDSLLTVGRSSRLYRALVDAGLATGVSSSLGQQIDPGWEDVYVTCPDKVNRDKVERAFDAAVADLQEKLISPTELAKAKRLSNTQIIFAMDGVSDQGSLLGAYEVTAGWRYLQTLTQLTDHVTAEQVRQAARKYLNADNRTVGWFVPTKITAEKAPPAGKPGPIRRRAPRQLGGLSALASLAPRATRAVLPNGLVLLLLENHANPTVALRGSVDAGGVFDLPKRPGLAALVAGMLDHGTATRPESKFHEELDALGAELSFSAGMDDVSIESKCLSQDTPKLLELVHDALCRPAFASEEFAHVRTEQLTALQEDEDSPYIAAWLELVEMLYPDGHPERHYTRGTPESVRATRRNDLLAFYRKYYRPDATTLVLVGDFDTAKMREQVEKLFVSWKATGPRPRVTLPPIPEPSKEATRAPIRVPISDKSEAIVLMASRGVDVHSSDYFAALVANHILGGGELLNSRLLTSLREKQGLTYSVSTEFRASRGERPWFLAMQNNPKNVTPAVLGALTELERLREKPPTADELDQARATLVGNLLLAMETNGGIAETLRDLEFYGLGLDWVQRAVERIRAVTPDDVLAAARKYVPAPEKVITVIAGPEK